MRGPPGRERECSGQGRAVAARTANLTFTAVGVAPEAMSAPGGAFGMGTPGGDAQPDRARGAGPSNAGPEWL